MYLKDFYTFKDLRKQHAQTSYITQRPHEKELNNSV